MIRQEYDAQNKTRPLIPLVLGFLVIGAGATLGLVHFRAQPHLGAALEARGEAPAWPSRVPDNSGLSPRKSDVPIEAASEPGQASTNSGDSSMMNSGGGSGGGAGGGEQKATVIKMDPLVANLDEGEQIRYVKITLQIEVMGDMNKIQGALPRARHESILYLSGLHLSDIQGQLGRQRVYRELQRRIADALGGGLKRIYFDEFVVQ